MWDVDDSGSINVTEMTNIIATMDDVEGVEQEPKVTQKSYTPCNMLRNFIASYQYVYYQAGQLFTRLSARMRAKEIFDRLDVDGDGEITMTEFVEGYLRLMK